MSYEIILNILMNHGEAYIIIIIHILYIISIIIHYIIQ